MVGARAGSGRGQDGVRMGLAMEVYLVYNIQRVYTRCNVYIDNARVRLIRQCILGYKS